MPEKQVRGPLGRTFNRVLGVEESRTDTGDMAFSRAQLKNYLDKNLQLADGEWFRGKKLDGVADALMEKLDKDGAGETFGGIDRDGSDSLEMGELQRSTKSSLPEGTQHADLVAQLGARMAIDAVDTNERDKKVADRRLSRQEWVAAARALAGG